MEAAVFLVVSVEGLVVMVVEVGLLLLVLVLLDADVGEVVLDMEDRLEADMVGLVLLLYSSSRLLCLLTDSGCARDCLA